MNKLTLKIWFPPFFLTVSTIVIFLLISCAGRSSVERYLPIMSYWRTDRNIIMSIHNTPEYGVAAVIKTSPGYSGKETEPGRAIIINIQPLVDGGYTGIFEVPGGQEPVKVKLILESRDSLIIMSWDKRVKGKIQKWQRVSKGE